MLRGSASWRHDEILLLVSVTFLLRGHIRRFTPAPLRFSLALVIHAMLLLRLHQALFIVHTALLMLLFVHTLLIVHALLLAEATVVLYTSFVMHTAQFVIPLVGLCLNLCLLLRLPLRNKGLFLSHNILATYIALMQAVERAD